MLKKKKIYIITDSHFSLPSSLSSLTSLFSPLMVVVWRWSWVMSRGLMVRWLWSDRVIWFCGSGFWSTWVWSVWVWSVHPKHLDSKSETSRDAKSQCHSVVSLLVVDQSILFFVGLSLWNFCFMGLSLWNLFFVGLSLWNFSILHESRFVKFVLGGSAIVG